MLTSRALERSFNGAATATWSHEAHIPEHFLRPPASESDEPQPVASTSAPSSDAVDPGRALPNRRRRRGGTGAASSSESRSSSSATAAAAAPRSQQDKDAGAAAARQPAPARSRSVGAPTPPVPSNPASKRPSRQAAPPPRPRLRPPPPPLSWPDYPYTRRPCASACRPHDTAGLKLEALFQCVLHYPRAPPKLLRFLRREVPDDVEARLAEITASVECLAEALGREVAVYLIRRSSWVVLVPAECLAPRMEAVRRLLGLAPGGVPDLLRKNPNLLRMQEGSMLGRYMALQEALCDAVGFDEHQLRALIIKYPLILNFKHESVRSALMALRRLCSARPDWTVLYKALSPSQVAFFMRERVVTLLRLEYLLLTGGGSGLTLRDIMKTSNNSFNRAHGGFRSWMQARLTRLRERLSLARRAVEARAAAEGRQLSREELERVAAEVQAVSARAEQERFHSEFMQRRDEERRDLQRRMEQRQRTIEERMAKDQQQRQQQQQPGREQEEEEEEDDPDEQRRRRRKQQQRLSSSEPLAAARGPASDAGAGGARQGGRPAGSPAAAAALSSDPLDRVTLGKVWQRPGSKVPAAGGSMRHYQQ